MLENVTIEQDKRDNITHKVIVNGREIQRVNHIDFNFDVSEVPQVNVGIVGGFDFEGMADIHFDYSPYTVKESCKILRDELLKHGDLYRAFELSMYSALKEMPKEIRMGDMCMNEAVNRILKRIMGDEQSCT